MGQNDKPRSQSKFGLLWAVALGLVPVYIWIAETNGRTFDGHFTWLHWIVAALGASSGAQGYLMRRKLMARATIEHSTGNLLVAARKWSAAQLVSVGTAQAVVLYGVVAKMSLGCPRWFSASFYVVGVVLLLLYRPDSQPSPAQS